MVEKLIFGLVLFFLLIMPVVFAMDTQINVKTLQDHRISIIIREAGQLVSLESFHQETGNGEMLITSSVSVDEIDLIITLKKDGQNILNEKFTNNSVGFPIFINFIPGDVRLSNTGFNIEPEINETVNETIEQTNETESGILLEEIEKENSVEVTGSAIFGDEGFLSRKIIYYSIGVFVLLIGFITIKTIKKKSKAPKEIKIKKLSEVRDEKKENLKSNEDIIADAERKIKEAQEDIRKIKNEDKIKEAKRKIIEDEKELMRLRRGED